jgi:diketogulonate reductase-like aldo/keto reductase
MSQAIEVRGARVPAIMYGTAWKEERTDQLTRTALAAGFRAIDTANQRKHYHEAGVGAAVAASGVPRAELFLQSKFTYQDGQDHRLPYDPDAPPASQVRQSFDSSCQHLGTDRIDSYVLHGPLYARGWSDEDRQVWRAMEELHRAGRAGLLGVSNVAQDQLELLCASAEVMPAFVQNRCFARTGWDRVVRDLCRRHGIVYQGFSLLTANRRELAAPAVAAIAARLGATVPQVVFSFAAAVGMLPLTGTTSRDHMREDLAALDLELSAADLATLEEVGAR